MVCYFCNNNVKIRNLSVFCFFTMVVFTQFYRLNFGITNNRIITGGGVSFKRLTYWLIILCIINILFGWKWEFTNVNGYNYVNFIFIYYLGRWTRLLSGTALISNKIHLRIFSLFVFLGATIINMLLFTLYVQFTDVSSIKWWSYNSPLVVLSSLSIVLFFSTLNFKSAIINFFSSATLAVYILHTKDFFYRVVTCRLGDIFGQYSYFGLLGFVVIVLLGLYLFCAPIDFFVKRITYSISSFLRTRACANHFIGFLKKYQ